MKKLIFIIILILAVFPFVIYAACDTACTKDGAIYTCIDANYECVQTAVTAATSGDTINITATGTVLWPALAVTVPADKPLKIYGPGATNLTINLQSATPAIYIRSSTENPGTEIKGFTFHCDHTSGSHTGADGQAILTDSTKTWTVNQYIGYRLTNTTNSAYCTITSNTINTATCTLSGSENWDTNDTYIITIDASAIAVAGQNWRIHDNIYDCSASIKTSGGMFVFGKDWESPSSEVEVTGVVDSNTIIRGRVLADGYTFPKASELWAADTNLGSSGNGSAIYIEDNTFTSEESATLSFIASDNGYGGKYVIRYNSFHNATLMSHGIQAYGLRNSVRSFEIYGNKFTSDIAGINTASALKSGTGVIYNNYFDNYNTGGGAGYYSGLFTFWHERSTTSTGAWGACDDTDENVDGQTSGQSGWLCRDQIGAGKDAAVWSSADSVAPVQSSEPVYVWGTYKGATLIQITNYTGTYVNAGITAGHDSSGTHIKTNRDWYDYNASFDGTSDYLGVGCGTTLPAVCVLGTAFWKTNQSCSNMTGLVGKVDVASTRPNDTYKISGTLYKCTSTDTWESYYTPYTYPHPLRGESPADATAPTTTISTSNSTITVNSLTVTGTSVDAVGVSGCKYRIGSAPDADNGTACTGTTSFSCAATGFASGSNTLYVGCYDAAGNYGSDSITVTFTPPTASGCTFSGGGMVR